ncbi:hypothetical protein R6Q57_010357 [Mikania cordata]
MIGAGRNPITILLQSMDVSPENDEQMIMEGWLYRIRSNKFGFQCSRKRYYILQNCNLKSFSSIPNFLNKLGARNLEEAAKWVEAIKNVSLKMKQHPGDILVSSTYEHHHSRLNDSGRMHDSKPVDYHLSLASVTNSKTADMSSHWTIMGCYNGLRLFKEARNHEDQKKRNGHQAFAAMSVIDGAPEIVFKILMSLGSSRSEWDFCFHNGSLVETIDGQTDIIHKLLKSDWLPWGMKRRDLLLQRYWRREDDGTYIILYNSVDHKKCPTQKNYVRACIKSGGYVISPTDQCKQSVVMHMLDIDWKLWRSCSSKYKYSDKFHSVRMIGRLAALREFFKTNIDDYLSEFSLQESKRKDLLHKSQTSTSDPNQRNENEESEDFNDDIVKMSDESDEFFDTSETFLDDQDTEPHTAVYRRDNANGVLCNHKFSLLEDQTGNLPNSWSVPELSLFQIRAKTYFKDRKKIKAQHTLMQTVAVEWLRSDKQENDLAARPGSIVQKFAADGRSEFFFIVNFQIPGSTTYNIASYYMTSTPIKDIPLLDKFVKGDDAFRNSRFKLLPHVTKGPWILKQSASRATLVGQLLKINYINGKNYIELDIDVGSFALARGLASTALSCFSSLIAETAFVIQANTVDELPEQLYGASRLNHLDVSKALCISVEPS